MRSFSMRLGGMLRRYGGFRRELGSHGQAGGGFGNSAAGAAAAFDPSQLTGLALWLKADAGVTDTGGLVDAWADQSGNGHDLTGSGGTRPSLVTNVINSLPAIRFASGGDKLLTWGTPWAQSAITTVYAVVKFNQNGADYQIFLNSNGGGAGLTRPYLGYNGANVNKPASYGGANTAIWGSALAAGNYVFRWKFNHTADTTHVRVASGTEVDGPGGVNLVVGNWTTMGLGLGVQELRSDIAEVIILDHAADATEDSNIMTYFTSRYGI